jgi:hypothetical protein
MNDQCAEVWEAEDFVKGEAAEIGLDGIQIEW